MTLSAFKGILDLKNQVILVLQVVFFETEEQQRVNQNVQENNLNWQDDEDD